MPLERPVVPQVGPILNGEFGESGARSDVVEEFISARNQPAAITAAAVPSCKIAGLARRLLHHSVMALKKSPPKVKKNRPRKVRVRETLKQQAERQFAKLQGRNPAGHIWLGRHFERQNGRCAYCGIPMLLPPLRGRKPRDRRATLDHVLPLARGGADSEANTVAACLACNAAKGGDMTAQAFRLSAFCIARQALAAKVPERKTLKPVIVTLRKRPRT